MADALNVQCPEHRRIQIEKKTGSLNIWTVTNTYCMAHRVSDVKEGLSIVM